MIDIVDIALLLLTLYIRITLPIAKDTIMKLAAKTRYATRILLELAIRHKETPIASLDLSLTTGITVQFIEQIAKVLKKNNFIRSQRGAKGGHMLSRAPEEITLGSVVRAMEGSIQLVHCQNVAGNICPRQPLCHTSATWERVSKVLDDELEAITLADLIDRTEDQRLGQCNF